MCKYKFKNLNNTVRIWLAIGSFVSGIAFGVAGMLIPPPGEIHGSILILIAQLLVLSATFIGLNLKIDLSQKKFEATHEINNHEDIENIEQAISHFDEKNIEKR